MKGEEWRARAGCTGSGVDFFDEAQQREALHLCSQCPAERACLNYAIRTRSKDGIWGGTTAAERAAMMPDDN